jgi:protein SCO1/2
MSGFVVARDAVKLSIAIIFLAASVGLAFELLYRSFPSEAAHGQTLHAEFHLHTQNGEFADSKAMLGRPYALFFGFTNCPAVCSEAMMEMARLAQEIGAAANELKTYFVSLDPEHDTPEVLSAFLSSFGPNFIGLTGSTEDIASAAAALRVYYRKLPLEGGGYTIDHTALVYLIDSRGNVVDSLSTQEPHASSARKLRKLLLSARQ